MLELKKSNYEDELEEYIFTKKLPKEETGFFNYFYDLTKEEFREKCLSKHQYEDQLKEIDANGTMPMTTFYLWLNGHIIGIFTCIHKLTEQAKNRNGHIAYAILEEYRHKGYASTGLAMVIEEMKDKIYEDYIYMHADIKSPYSIKVMLDNDAEIIKKDQTGYYTKIKIR